VATRRAGRELRAEPGPQRQPQPAKRWRIEIGQHIAGKAVRVNWKTNAWANINRRNHGNEFHTHPGAYWSGTYYVDDGGLGEDASLGGEFEMQDPRGMYAPLLGFAVPGGQSAGASELIRPHAGQLVLFPSWLPHAVRPYRGDRERISVAFNFGL
jgi:uncharacterized protein (TIGR02466 family)